MSIPQPAFTVNFETGEHNTPAGFQLMEGAAIKDGAPGAVSKALRIDRDGPYVLFPNLDISPSKYPELTMIIEFYLESIPEGSKGWLLNHDNGGYDRSLVLHDARFNGISHGVGYPAGPVYDKYTAPEVGKWVQMVVTYRQGGECAVFVSNEKAPITHEGKNNEGKSSLTLGRVVPYKNHWCDCWIKGVSVYDTALSDEEVDSVFGKFEEEVIVPSGEASDEESVDEGEVTVIGLPEPVPAGVQNVALGKHCAQSSTQPNWGGVASNAVNGITTGKRKNANSTVTCTADVDASPWWQVYLCGVYDICKINIFNRDSLEWRNKLKDFTVEVISGGKVVWSSGIITEFPNPEAMITIPGGTTGDMVKISKNTKHLIMAEVQVWGTPSTQTVPAPEPEPEPEPETWRSNTAGQNGGNPFDDSAKGDLGKITQIRVCTDGSHVSAIETSYENSGTYTNGNGGPGNVRNWYTFTLQHDEYIVAITGKASHIINSIGFITSSGRVSATHGGGGGNPFRIEKDNMVVKHFFGRSAWMLDQIGAMFTSAPKPKPEPKPVISITNGDEFKYAPWGGNCMPLFRNGVLWCNRIGTPGGTTKKKVWKCKDVADTKKLLNGETVSVEWDNSGKYHSMTAIDNDTLKVMHGTTAYYFKRSPPFISIKDGDLFHYGPWGGNCTAFFRGGRLYMNRIGSDVNGIKSWRTKSVIDRMKILDGQTVSVEWDNSGKYLSMTATDNNTFKVMHGTTAYYFKRV